LTRMNTDEVFGHEMFNPGAPMPPASSVNSLFSVNDGGEVGTPMMGSVTSDSAPISPNSVITTSSEARSGKKEVASECGSDDSDSDKKNKRERNRESAAKYRKKRKEHVNTLEDKVNNLTQLVTEKSTQIFALETENKQLKDQIGFLKRLFEMSTGGNGPKVAAFTLAIFGLFFVSFTYLGGSGGVDVVNGPTSQVALEFMGETGFDLRDLQASSEGPNGHSRKLMCKCDESVDGRSYLVEADLLAAIGKASPEFTNETWMGDMCPKELLDSTSYLHQPSADLQCAAF